MKKKFSSAPVKTGEEIEVKVTDLAYGGDGVAKYKNFAVFIPYSIPGGVLLVVIEIVKKNYARAVIKKVIKDSPYFTPPKCRHFRKCGGCHWMNMKYEKQIEYKKKIFSQMTGRVSADIMPSPKPFYYRNRAQYKLSRGPDKIVMGFYRAKSHEVEGVEGCLLLREKINEIARNTAEFLNIYKKEVAIYSERTGSGYLRGVAIRVNREGGALVTFITAKNSVKKFLYEYAAYIKKRTGKIAGVTVNINTKKINRVFGEKEKVIYGSGALEEEAGGIKFKLFSSSFFQVNPEMAEKMIDFVKRNTEKESRVLDIYGGTGMLSLPLADMAREITIVESDEKAAASAAAAIEENNLYNAEIIRGRAETEIGKIIKAKNIDTVILDPPRKGAHPDVLNAVKRQKPKKVIYISCNPATYARDINNLSELYEISELVPMDLFPQTYHIEIMSCLRLKQQKEKPARRNGLNLEAGEQVE